MKGIIVITLLISSACNHLKDFNVPIKNKTIADSLTVGTNQNKNLTNSRAQVFRSVSGIDYLLNVSQENNSIFQYDISNRTLFSEYSLSDVGINANLILDFTCISTDEIVLLKVEAPHICLINKRNTTSDLKFTLPDQSYGVLQPNNNFRLTTVDDHHIAFGLRKHSKSKIGYFMKPIISVYDFPNGSVLFDFGKYPLRYFFSSGFPSMLNPSVAYARNKVVLSFGPQHYLYIYNLSNGQFVERVTAKSNFTPKKIQSCKWKAPSQETYNYLVTNPFYLGIYYDSYRDRFYRVVKHSQDLENHKNQLNSFYSASWSIMVFTNQLKFIEEWIVNASNLDFTKLLVTSKGILIPSLNESNKFYIINEESIL